MQDVRDMPVTIKKFYKSTKNVSDSNFEHSSNLSIMPKEGQLPR